LRYSSRPDMGRVLLRSKTPRESQSRFTAIRVDWWLRRKCPASGTDGAKSACLLMGGIKAAPTGGGAERFRADSGDNGLLRNAFRTDVPDVQGSVLGCERPPCRRAKSAILDPIG
jgi:hypothetical protein